MASLRPRASIALVIAAASLGACSSVDRAIVATENGASRIFAGGPATPPPRSVDPQSLNWQKLRPSSPVQFALLSGANVKAGTTEVALRVPAGEAIPAFWQDVPEAYTVMSGTFVVEAIDASGLPQHITQPAGATAQVPARMIQNIRSTAASDGVLLLTVYGEWKPNFVDDGRPIDTQSAAN